MEWGLEWFYYRLRRLALFDLLELAGRCTVLVIAIFWLLEADDRTKERHYRAWELINTASGSSGDGGRWDALQDLNRDGISLIQAPLENAYLEAVDLNGAELQHANLEGANLGSANLERAELLNANLERANLWGANLESAWLERANLKNAILVRANLMRADFEDANLVNADLQYANLMGADFEDANLVNASLRDANLESAWLERTNLAGANLEGANLRGAWDLTQEQLEAAIGDEKTVLPEGLTRPSHWITTPEKAPPPTTQE